MRHAFLLLSLAVLALAATTPAFAAENKNSVTFDIHCTIDGQTKTLTGTLYGGAGGALHLAVGGNAIAMGLRTLSGEVIAEPTPGLSQQGKLVDCRFRFPGAPADLIASVFFPAGAP